MKKIGIDIVENTRIKLNDEFLKKFLTKQEMTYLKSVQSTQRQIEFAAGRWAVKEAIFKVLTKTEHLAFNQIEIAYDAEKCPIILNSELANIAISISHERHFSVAVAMQN
ncbi:holo-ACP synthase [Williamsoniiplasma lucivorax]|uniref:Holo-[acyl-carrier-protein] synthase n=1 Tax=Williamsoniiplasma lucivorax TaxID=209274 RepID=A0A2S5RDU9_9MOLU|nr:4'-phosphopantetheinyl transferase superfamily protein [Williamsoniiplasma lucivorax]PPE05477.1 holo-[acyl-carrier-protein] synthase [Williamsoniiplasma lucivorax]